MPDKTIAEILNIKPDKSLTIFNPPKNDDGLVDNLAQDISISDGDPADILLAFINDREHLKRNILNLKSNIKKDGSLWIAWQKGGNGDALNQDFIAKVAAAKNLKKESVYDLDEKWKIVQFKIGNA